MTLEKFLQELQKTPRKWEIINWPDACQAIRIDDVSSPLTFVCKRVKKEKWFEYGIGDYDLAAQELGIDNELAEKIEDATNFSMRNLNTPEKRKIRTELLKATGLSRQKSKPR